MKNNLNTVLTYFLVILLLLMICFFILFRRKILLLSLFFCNIIFGLLYVLFVGIDYIFFISFFSLNFFYLTKCLVQKYNPHKQINFLVYSFVSQGVLCGGLNLLGYFFKNKFYQYFLIFNYISKGIITNFFILGLIIIIDYLLEVKEI